MSGILSNAISGLQASQIALRTAGNNISNANTAGYSRQEVNFTTRQEQQFGNAGFLGSGVNTESVKRVVNEFISTQMRLDTTTFNQLDKYNQSIGKIDKLFSDTNTGLIGSLQSFFSSLQNGASDPSSSPARQLIITQAQSLSLRYNTLYDRLDETSKSVNNELGTIMGQVNALAKSVGNLNQSIAEKNASASGGAPNELLDQRDEALRKLSELVSVQLVKQDGGDVNVFIGNGEPLVVGNRASAFTVQNGGKIYLSNNTGSASDVTDAIAGGQLGGLLKFKDDVLQPSLNEIGRIAIVMSDAFNKVQTQGLDSNGNYGQAMFTDINDESIIYSRVAHGVNALPDDRVLSLTIENAGAITIDDYKFEITAGTNNYTIKRASDNSVVNQGIISGAHPQEIKFDGLKLTLESGTFQGGDSFTLQPTRTGARDVHALLKTPDQLAFASPIRTTKSGSNTGNGTVSAGEVLSLYDAKNNLLPSFEKLGALTPPLMIRFTSDTTYELLDNTDPSNPKALNPPVREQTFYPGRENAIFTTDKGEHRIVGNGSRTGLPADRLPASLTSSSPAQANGYPVEQFTFSTVDKTTGQVSTQVMIAGMNASAAQTAAQINGIHGARAHAYTTATITDINIDPTAFTSPLQLSLNGENLIKYSAGGAIVTDVPDPSVDETAFNNYIRDQINSNENLKALGIRATSGSNPVTGKPEINLVASSGVNLDIRFSATNATNNNISVNDSNGNPNVRLTGIDNPLTVGVEQSAITVGGKIDITLADGVTIGTAPTTSQLLGDSTAENFAVSSYMGYQVKIAGQPKAGDTFSIDFNKDSKNDNRNALAMTALETNATMENKSMSFSQGYGRLVEEIGTKSNLSQINTDASKSLLEQTKTMHDGISSVNMDEEAAKLIQFQQLYTANARVITVAKDLFDALLQSLG
ncbi:MAG: flagellar hook-associated protein FlgK [Gammaproteobacteria bacterium]|nr:MAG: flagellar hook-associated protein FlgK [Gammaproteobacteria bacterium]